MVGCEVQEIERSLVDAPVLEAPDQTEQASEESRAGARPDD